MNYIRHLNAFFIQIQKDDRLTTAHFSLYIALFQFWNFHRFQNPFPIDRTKIMQLSKIGSKNTYHKCVRQLHLYGYIIYHPAPSRYLHVRISIIHLDIKNKKEDCKQLALFNELQLSPGQFFLEEKPTEVQHGSRVPNMTTASPNNDTQHVSNMGQYIKQENILKNNVFNTPTKNFEMKKKENKNELPAPRPNLGLAPTVNDVEQFFKEHFRSEAEAHKFFYYNQSKNWMLTDKIQVYDWKALALKWMLNDTVSSGMETDLSKELQLLYEKYLHGQQVAKMIIPEFFDQLQLQLSDTILQEAKERRMNQLSGSNENSETKLWQAYMTGNNNHELTVKDQPNLIIMAKRLAVIKHFQKLKAKGQQCIL